jgi:tetratricopeptide (TPR) repeat protein
MTPNLKQSFEMAVQQHRAGRLTAAEALYRQILSVAPDHAESLHMLGVLAGQAGDVDAAVDMVRRAIAAKPGQAVFHLNLGEIYRRTGKHDLGAGAYAEAARLWPKSEMAHYCLGLELAELGRPEEATASYQQAIRLKPDFADAYAHLAIAAMQLGRTQQAIEAQQALVRLRPGSADAWNNLGTALAEAGRTAEAIAADRRAVSLSPGDANARNNLAAALGAEGQYEQALLECREALRLQSELAEAHNNLGSILTAMARLDEAGASFRRALAISPDHASAHFNLALALLIGGNWPAAWPEYEWRWKCYSLASSPRRFSEPQWGGEPLEDRTILLHAEQGLGDTIQFVRYVPLVAERGAKVLLECQPELRRLLGGLPGVGRLIARGEERPRFDLQCPLMSLPRAFGTTVDSIPGPVPYLAADKSLVAAWVRRLASPGKPSGDAKVGLVWSGNPTQKNNRLRSIPLASLGPLAGVKGVRFLTLQKGQAADQARALPPGMGLEDFTGDLTDFAETAALLANLDLIITVDTAVSHLAGAMGLKVWALLCYAPDWRWLLGRGDSPFYPTMRLFRQRRPGDWDGVVAGIRSELEAFRRDFRVQDVPT